MKTISKLTPVNLTGWQPFRWNTFFEIWRCKVNRHVTNLYFLIILVEKKQKRCAGGDWFVWLGDRNFIKEKRRHEWKNEKRSEWRMDIQKVGDPNRLFKKEKLRKYQIFYDFFRFKKSSAHIAHYAEKPIALLFTDCRGLLPWTHLCLIECTTIALKQKQTKLWPVLPNQMITDWPGPPGTALMPKPSANPTKTPAKQARRKVVSRLDLHHAFLRSEVLSGAPPESWVSWAVIWTRGQRGTSSCSDLPSW